MQGTNDYELRKQEQYKNAEKSSNLWNLSLAGNNSDNVKTLKKKKVQS